MSDIDSGNTVMTAVAAALIPDKIEKGLYPEDLYLVNYLTKAAQIFQKKGLTEYERTLWGIKIRGVASNGPEGLRISFNYSLDRALTREDLSPIITLTDTFYIRCLGCEIFRSSKEVEVRIDGDDMVEGKQYNIVFEAPETFKCMWRQ